MLQIPAQGSCAELRVVGRVDDEGLGGGRQLARELLVGKALVERGDLQVDDAGDVLLRERLVEHDLVEPVEEFGAEAAAQECLHFVFRFLRDLARRRDAVQDRLRAEVGGQDDDGVLEVHGPALRVGDAAVVEDLQEDVEHVRMRLFDLVKEDDGVRTAADGLSQLAALLITHVSGRCADQTRDGEFLHILRHVDAHEVLFIVKQGFGQRLGQLRLADAGGAEEEERAERAVRVLDAGAAALDGLGDDAHGLILADDALVERIFEMQQLVALALHEAGSGDAGPALDDLGDLLLCDLVAQQTRLLAVLRQFFLLLELLFRLGQVAVFELRGLFEVVALLGGFDVAVQLLDLLTQLLHAADGVLFVFPFGLHGVEGLALLGQLLLQLGKSCLGELVVFVLERGLLDLHLDDLAVDDVQLGRHGVHLGADHGAGLVDEVDGLVGQEPVGDIAVTERGGGDDGVVGDLDAVEDLVAGFQTTQDGDGILHRRLLHQNGLEPALERGILFDILAVFVERGRADAVQLAAREHRLQEVACVHRAFGLACAHDGVQLVDEQDDAAFGLLDLGQHGLQPFLKLAAVFCARDQRTHVEREDRLVLQRLRDLVRHDPLRQTLDDGRLADARLADEHGVILGLAGEDADDVADLVVTADDGVHLLLSCALDEIRAVFGKRLIRILRRVGGHALVAADRLQRLQAAFLCDLIGAEEGLERVVRVFDQREEQVLDGDVFVLHLLCDVLGLVESGIHRAGDVVLVGLAAGAGHARELVQLRVDGGFETFGREAHLFQQLRHKAVFLPQQGGEQVDLLDLLVLVFNGQLLGGLDGLQRFLGIVLCVHGNTSVSGVSTLRS